MVRQEEKVSMRASTTKDLARKELIVLKAGKPLQGARLRAVHQELGGSWQLVDDHHLERDYRFQDFKQALAFTHQIGELAESVDHHPEICLTWGRVSITIWTHSIGGLSEADFIFAARVENRYNKWVQAY